MTQQRWSRAWCASMRAGTTATTVARLGLFDGDERHGGN